MEQPSKLKFLPGRHLATNSFGLGRLFYKSSRQLQNFRRHGDQTGCNLEGCGGAYFRNFTVFLLSTFMQGEQTTVYCCLVYCRVPVKTLMILLLHLHYQLQKNHHQFRVKYVMIFYFIIYFYKIARFSMLV